MAENGKEQKKPIKCRNQAAFGKLHIKVVKELHLQLMSIRRGLNYISGMKVPGDYYWLVGKGIYGTEISYEYGF